MVSVLPALVALLGCPPGHAGKAGAPDTGAPDSVAPADSGDSGADTAAGNPNDADGDGYIAIEAGGDDCDDHDPTIHPGAEEVWYDGIDQDCDGADDFDADRDGHPAEAFGGDDCDDFDETRYPGAAEHCDGLDHDCDGEVAEGSNCSAIESIDQVVSPRWVIDGAGSFVDDVSGDGLADIDFPVAVSEATGGMADPLVSPERNGPGPVGVEEAAFAVVAWAGSYGRGQDLNAGDLDGDGINDLAYISSTSSQPAVLLFFGPIPTDGRPIYTRDADAYWAPHGTDLQDSEWGGYYSRGDFDGDGRMDLAVSGASPTCVFFGGTWSTETESQAAEIAGGRRVDSHGDLDGDGLDDLLVGDNEGLYLIPGGSLAPGAASLPELASLFINGRSATDEVGIEAGPRALTDLDGDGYGEVMAYGGTDRADCRSCEEALYFRGNATGELSAYDAVGGWAPAADGENLGMHGPHFDFDGDGKEDGVIYLHGDEGPRYCILPGHYGIPPAILTPVPEHVLCYAWPAYLSGGPDATGDGIDDLVANWPVEDTNYGLAGILPGWDVPWDDDSYW